MSGWLAVVATASVQFAVVVAVAVIFDRTLLRRAAPRARVALWAAVLLPLALPIRPQIAEVPAPWRVEVTESVTVARPETRRVTLSSKSPGTRSAPRPSSGDGERKDAVQLRIPGPKAEVSTPAPAFIPTPAPPPEPLPWRSALVLIWAAGVVFLLGRALLAEIRLRRILAVSPRSDERVRRLAAEAARIAGLRRVPDALRCDALPSPAVHGVRRPRILVPATALTLDDDELRAVLVHESFHVRYRDLVWTPFVALLRALWWFHPLVPLTCRALADALEEARDHDALIALGALDASAPLPHSPARLAYARVLVQLAEARAGAQDGVHLPSPAPVLAPGVIPLTRNGRGLTRRVAMILTQAPSHRFATLGGVSLAACVVSLGLVRAGTAATPDSTLSTGSDDAVIAVERQAALPAWRAAIDAKLAERFDRVTFDGTDLVAAFESIGKHFDLQMRVHPDAIDDNGYEAAGLSVTGLSCAELLDLLCLNGETLAWSVACGTVHVGEAGNLPCEADLRFYRVAPLVQARGLEDEDDLIEFVMSFGSGGDAGHRLQDSWEIEGWSIDMWRGLLAVRCTEETHRAVQTLLNRALVAQERPEVPAEPWRERVEAALDKRIDIEMNDLECSAALEQISAIIDVPILHPVEHADDQGNVFNFKLEGVLVRDVLGWIAADQQRHVFVADGVIVLGQELDLETRMFSIASLLALSGDSPDELVYEVTEFIFGVDPASWDSTPYCSVTRLGDLLVIRQTASNQDKIGALLKQMERALGG